MTEQKRHRRILHTARWHEYQPFDKTLIHVEARPGHILFLRYDDGVEGEVCIKKKLYGAVFEQLKDELLFNQVFIDADFNCVSWPNDADLAPDVLYEDLVFENTVRRAMQDNPDLPESMVRDVLEYKRDQELREGVKLFRLRWKIQAMLQDAQEGLEVDVEAAAKEMLDIINQPIEQSYFREEELLKGLTAETAHAELAPRHPGRFKGEIEISDDFDKELNWDDYFDNENSLTNDFMEDRGQPSDDERDS